MVKKAPYIHYLRPPIDAYQTLEFAKFSQISDVGYQYASAKFTELIQSNSNIKEVRRFAAVRRSRILALQVTNPDALILHAKQHRRRRHERAQSMRNSFTDLAAEMTRIPRHARRSSLTDASVFDGDWHDGERAKRNAR